MMKQSATSTPITTFDVVKLVLALSALTWMAVDWQGYSAAVNASAFWAFGGLAAAFVAVGSTVGPILGDALTTFSSWAGEAISGWIRHSLRNVSPTVK